MDYRADDLLALVRPAQDNQSATDATALLTGSWSLAGESYQLVEPYLGEFVGRRGRKRPLIWSKSYYWFCLNREGIQLVEKIIAGAFEYRPLYSNKKPTIDPAYWIVFSKRVISAKGGALAIPDDGRIMLEQIRLTGIAPESIFSIAEFGVGSPIFVSGEVARLLIPVAEELGISFQRCGNKLTNTETVSPLT